MSPKRKADHGEGSSSSSMPKRARKSTAEEKRMARFVSRPSVAVRERMERAYVHRLYLIEKKVMESGCEFFVLGVTGNVYSVKLEKRPLCTCPDAAKGNLCKHYLFVMLRVLKLPQSDPRVWQKALLSSELAELLTMSASHEGVLASQLVRQRFHEITGNDGPAPSEKTKQRDLEGDCPICYESMAGTPGEPVVFCKSCGNNVHQDCFERWSRSKRSSGARVTCIYCRAEWDDLRSKKSQTSDGGYVNLASYSAEHAPHSTTSLESLYPNSWEWINTHNRRPGPD